MRTHIRFRSFLAAMLLVTLTLPALARDWTRDPAWVEVPHAPLVAVIGDVHGGFAEMAATLQTLGVARRNAPDSFDLTWTGKTALLISLGDVTDRGLYTRECYDAIFSLEEQAAKAGGRVIPLLGNHECLLLNGQVEKWAQTLKPPKQQHYQNTIDSFVKGGYDFHQAISKNGRYGSWIRRRPLFAIVNGFLFVHGGACNPAVSRSDLAADFRDAIEADDFSKGIFMNQNGPLWMRDWWDDPALVEANLERFGVRGIVFGHTIGALGTEGRINVRDERLVAVDVGMSPAYAKSRGGGLLITAEPAGTLLFVARYPDRPEELLFRVPASPAGSRPAAPAGAGANPAPANEQLPAAAGSR